MAIADQTTANENYQPRIIDAQVERYLRTFGGVVIEGAKWCGKTWTGLRHTKSAIYADRAAIQRLTSLEPESLFTSQRPMLVDEWQDALMLWDVARRQIDDAGKPGQFIFTGSAVPPLSATKHSGTGRFARLRMRPMSLAESGQSTSTVSLRALFDGPATIKTTVTDVSYHELVRLICRGGWPMAIDLPDDDALLVPRSYIQAVAESDISRADGIERDPRRVMAVLRSLARNTASYARIAKIQQDVTDQERADDPDRPPSFTVLEPSISDTTIRTYLKALDRIFVTEDLPAWRFALRSKTQLRLSPKRYFVDPSLAVAALGVNMAMLEADPNTTGLLFESLVIRDLRIYAQATDGEVFQYHDNKDLEADAVVTTPSGQWGAVEIKLGWQQEDQAAANLLRLKNKLRNTPNLAEPSFLLIITGVSIAAHTRDDGVHVVPINPLGA